tara:strand:+ start:76 stop:573 length:498 start_codon:yes stop_codon:yes gene_type:complete
MNEFNLSKTIKLLALKGYKELPFPDDIAKLLQNFRDAEYEIKNYAEEYVDEIMEQVFHSGEQETVISLSYDYDMVSFCNHIFEFYGLFFFSGTDLDELGPFSSFIDAWAKCDYFTSLRQEGYVDLYYRSDVPIPCIREILTAHDGCNFNLSNENGQINLKDIKIS